MKRNLGGTKTDLACPGTMSDTPKTGSSSIH